jgi:hypothetical protein
MQNVASSIVIDNLTTRIDVDVDSGDCDDVTTFRFRQSGFADVRIHWSASPELAPESKSLAEEVVIEAVRNTEISCVLADIIFQEVHT